MNTASPLVPVAPRTVLVTGAARRLGREIALALAAAGWQVALHYRTGGEDAMETIAACQGLAPAAAGFACDLEDESATRELVPRVVARFGRLDAVVNSASRFEHDDAASFGYAAAERHLRANAAAAIVLAGALHAHLAARGAGAAAGVVVNLLDQKLFNPNPDFLSYTLSKAALQAATELLAQALAPLVRVVGVAPGLTLPSATMGAAQFERLHRLSPLGRSSTAREVADAVRFALDNRALTGTTLQVDGGQHLMPLARDFSCMPATDDAPVDAETKWPDARMQPGPAAIETIAAAAPAGAGQGLRTLTLTGLRFDASLGILEHEKRAPQPIQVDAELNLGAQPLAPQDDDIHHVLDYRRVRQIVIDECTAAHVNLLESLIGKLCQRLLALPGVRGVRVRITKLEIFDDCEVAIRMESGAW